MSDQIFSNQMASPLGHILSAGYLKHALGVPVGETRCYTTYGLIYLLKGSGMFRDASGFETEIETGDLVLLFPGIEHEYRPASGTTWEEIYLLFDGAIFDLWMRNGVMTTTEPILKLHSIDYWREELNQLIGWRPLLAHPEALKQICALQCFLAAAFCEQENLYETGRRTQWIERACSFLKQGQSPQVVAREMGQSYDAFRKEFVQQTGMAPGKYRAKSQMHRAAEMLVHHHITLAEIAEELGFSDAYHFSNRFKQLTGESPREFRKRTPRAS